MDESGVAIPGPFTRNVIFNVKQDALKQVKSDLERLLTFARSRSRTFYPLSSPNLFLKFANLGGKKINEYDVMEWVHHYGVLGLGLKERVGNVQSKCLGGPEETVAAFAREAEEANWIKRVYEAALLVNSADNEAVQQAMRELRELLGWSAHHQLSSQECQEEAFRAVTLGVQSHLDHHCLVRWRRARNGLVEFLEFRTVLGAMYMQFAWVLREKASVRRCQYCGKPVGDTLEDEEHPSTKRRKTHKNKRFCGDECRYAFTTTAERRNKPQSRVSRFLESQKKRSKNSPYPKA